MVRARQTILIVEDDQDLAKMYRLALVSEGFRVAHVPDGLNALRYLEQHVPDLIILDLGLPHLDGRSVGQEVRARADTRDIPLIIVTGLPEPLDDVPGDCVLRKPAELTKLVATVRRCLNRLATAR